MQVGRKTGRQLLATTLALLGLLRPDSTGMKTVAVWDIYAIVYVALTWLAFRRQPTDVIYQIVRRSRADRTSA
jgi:hypothetical protein